MNRAGILPRRYAKALFLVGSDRGILDKIQEDWALFVHTLKEKQDFYHFFVSPEVSRREKEEKIEELFGDIFSNVFYNFLLVILKNQRQNVILEIAEAFNVKVDQSVNRTKAVVTSAVELPAELRTQIQQQLSKDLNKEIILVTQRDPTLIGGIRIMVEGKVIDGSIKGKLRMMRDFLMQKPEERMN
ncbi:MAG: ATP synthase F1 subunit delta [bacterium]